MNKKTFNFLLTALATHLFFVNTKLLYHLAPDTVENILEKFLFTRPTESTIVAILSALAYSLMTALVLKLLEKANTDYRLYYILGLAAMDGLGVFVYYSPFGGILFRFIGATYYGLYTGGIIIGIGLLFQSKKEELSQSEPEIERTIDDIVNDTELSIDEKVMLLKGKNQLLQKEIAQKLSLSEVQVSRIIKKSEKNG